MLFAEDKVKIETLKRAAITARLVHEYLRRKAVINATDVVKNLDISIPTTATPLILICIQTFKTLIDALLPFNLAGRCHGIV